LSRKPEAPARRAPKKRRRPAPGRQDQDPRRRGRPRQLTVAPTPSRSGMRTPIRTMSGASRRARSTPSRVVGIVQERGNDGGVDTTAEGVAHAMGRPQRVIRPLPTQDVRCSPRHRPGLDDQRQHPRSDPGVRRISSPKGSSWPHQRPGGGRPGAHTHRGPGRRARQPLHGRTAALPGLHGGSPSAKPSPTCDGTARVRSTMAVAAQRRERELRWFDLECS
jgi:hypothetical protein